jgi:hypothetical protein
MKKIEFLPWNEEVLNLVDSPLPAKKCIPDWYKKSFNYVGSNKISFTNNKPNLSIKKCVPVIDAMMSGYIQKTWCDIYIEQNDAEIVYHYSSGPEIVSHRDKEVKQHLPTPIGCNDIMLDWKRYWIPKTPIGYSILYIHPMYHFDLPFVVVPGIVDSDRYHVVGLNSPSFFLKQGFTGLIPRGTPMYQIFPFKKDSWRGVEKNKKYKDKMQKQEQILNSLFFDKYKRYFWNKKRYI